MKWHSNIETEMEVIMMSPETSLLANRQIRKVTKFCLN